MKSILASFPILIGIILLLYVFTLGEIWNNHSVQQYVLLAAGCICAAIGFAALSISHHLQAR